jgi:hypothetical protein
VHAPLGIILVRHQWSIDQKLSLSLSLSCSAKSRTNIPTNIPTSWYPSNSNSQKEKHKQQKKKRKESSRELAPPEILHILILVLARPHDLALPQRLDMRDGRDEPHDDEEDRQRAADAVDAGAVEGGADLDGREGQAGVGEDELIGGGMLVGSLRFEGKGKNLLPTNSE